MPSTPQLSPVEEQEKLLDEALGIVKVQAHQMKRCLDKGKLTDALKPATAMLAELRTSLLSPKNYYQLYMAVTDELRHLESYMHDEFHKGKQVKDLYELVQYAGNIVPRLYLLITVGLVYIRKNTALRRDILRDLVEMCRGVQHPLRGLFLRNYLLQCTRNVLPDAAEVENEAEGTVRDSIDFVLMNFAEMNKLWVRMQHQGHSRDKERREREREELRILVGTNLVRLSQLEAIALNDYRRLVLPGLLEQIVSCRDAIAQEYLMECVIQVFPDEFHLHTLQPFLRACADLQSGVNVKNVVCLLMERLAVHSQREGKSLDGHLFEIFAKQVAEMARVRSDLPVEDVISLQTALLNLSLRCYPDRIEFVDEVLERSQAFLGEQEVVQGSVVARELSRLLRIPVDHYNSVCAVLELKNYAALCAKLDMRGRKTLAIHLVNNALDNDTVLSTVDLVEKALQGPLSALVAEPEDPDPEELVEEQSLLARLVHQMRNSDADTQFSVLVAAKKLLGTGSAPRLRFTLPPLIFQAYRLALRYHELRDSDDNWVKKCDKIFQFCRSAATQVARADHPELALRLYLQGALVISQIASEGQETAAYEFVSQAFSIYEDELSDSRSQLSGLMLLIGALEKMECFGEENSEPLRTQCALAAGKLLKKPDQCRAVIACSHLFISVKQPPRALECLRKSLRIAKQCMDVSVQVQLLVELLDHFAYLRERDSQLFPEDMKDQLVAKIQEELPNLETAEDTDQITKHLKNTLDHLALPQKAQD